MASIPETKIQSLIESGATALVQGVPESEYHAIDLPSASALKVLDSQTNAHLAHQRSNPRDESDAFALGSYLHAIVLTPQLAETAFVVAPRVDRRTKEGKAAWEDATRRASLLGATLIGEDAAAQAQAMADAIRRHPVAGPIISAQGMREVTCIGRVGGRLAKARFDALLDVQTSPDTTTTIIVDLKSTLSAAPREFSRSATQFGYWLQAAFYWRLAAQFREVDDFIYLAVEKDAPHLVAAYRVPQLALSIADARIDKLVDRWWAVKAGDATGYEERITELEPPTWWTEQQI
jgi:hypothetical protein